MKKSATASTVAADEQIGMETHSYTGSHSGRYLLILAWAVTLLISTLPEVVWMELTGSSPARLEPCEGRAHPRATSTRSGQRQIPSCLGRQS